MYTKYAGTLGNYEAEIVKELLDRFGDPDTARKAVSDALKRCIAFEEDKMAYIAAKEENKRWWRKLARRFIPVPECPVPLDSFDRSILAITYAELSFNQTLRGRFCTDVLWSGVAPTWNWWYMGLARLKEMG